MNITEKRTSSTSPEEACDKYFYTIVGRVKMLLNPPVQVEQAYIFPTDLIDNNPVLMASMFQILDSVGSHCKSPIIMTMMARKLLGWLLRERPDVIDSLLHA
ncbi:hypothetical protein INT48_002335 [Thamnidium elegans]|uniref:Uncharacterized protein n=1 Tax=Thamnidium elegans TaxID=101142 RepID=A0A8H7VWN9_9FUNG|nr:hypothetical protein INT48_002335 [Thamnidium elegans]